MVLTNGKASPRVAAQVARLHRHVKGQTLQKNKEVSITGAQAIHIAHYLCYPKLVVVVEPTHKNLMSRFGEKITRKDVTVFTIKNHLSRLC